MCVGDGESFEALELEALRGTRQDCGEWGGLCTLHVNFDRSVSLNINIVFFHLQWTHRLREEIYLLGKFRDL